MVGYGARVTLLLALLLLIPFASADDLLTGKSFTMTQASPATSFTVSQAGPYKSLVLEFDLAIPADWRSELPDDQEKWFYPLIGIRQTSSACTSTSTCLLSGVTIKKGGSSDSPRTILESQFGDSTGAAKVDWAGWQAGKTYHVTMNVNGETKKTDITIRRADGQTTTVSYDIPKLAPEATTNLKVSIGIDRDGLDGAYFQLRNAAITNLKLTGTPGTFESTGGDDDTETPGEPFVFQPAGYSFTSTAAKPMDDTLELNVPAGYYNKIEAEFDVTPGAFSDVKPKMNVHHILWLCRGSFRGNCFFGSPLIVEHSSLKTSMKLGSNVDNPDPGIPEGARQEKKIAIVPGQKYHYSYVYDAVAKTNTLTIKKDGATILTLNPPATILTDSFYYKGPKGEFGMSLGSAVLPDPDPSVSTIGWKFENLKVTFTPADADNTAGGTGTFADSVTDGSNYQPLEEDVQPEIIYEKQDFKFIPEGCGSATTVCAKSTTSINVTPVNDKAYEKVILTFDFKINDLLPEGVFNQIVTLSDGCSDKKIADLAIRHHSGDETYLDARAFDKVHKGSFAYEVGKVYTARIVYDTGDTEAYVQILDGATVVQTMGGRTNTNTADMWAKPFTDGFHVVFSMPRGYPGELYSRPLGWEFTNVKVEAVPFGASSGDMGPDGADLGSDDGRLAFLAATLLDVADDTYRMDCGPVGEVLTTPPAKEPSDGGKRYCVLESGDQVIIGTFGTGNESSIVESYKDPRYDKQIPISAIHPEKCIVDATKKEFQECKGAIDGFKVYAFVHPESETTMLVVSEDSVSLGTSLLDSIVSFFRDLFGLSPTTVGVSALPMQKFHHGYFSSTQNRVVAATWMDHTAVFSYKNFVTNFSAQRPTSSTYALGREQRQTLSMDLRADSPADVQRWRQFTSALRITNAAGTPIQGDTCGNGYRGADEQCEPGDAGPACSTISPLLTEGTLGCSPVGTATQCQWNISTCMPDNGMGCSDDWVPVSRPAPCMIPYYKETGEDPLCPESRDGGGGGGGGGCTTDADCSAGLVCTDGTCQAPNCKENGVTCAADGDCCSEYCGLDSHTCRDPVDLPSCPSEQVKVKEQGSYDIYVRAGPDGKPQLRTVYVARPPGTSRVCYQDGLRDYSRDGNIDFPSTWVTHNPGEITVLYQRIKEGSNGHNDLKIVAQHDATSWSVRGWSGGLSSPNNPGAGHECWACNSAYCEDMVISVPIDLAPECDPNAGPPAGTCTGTNSCCKLAEPCTEDADCCLYTGDDASGAYCDSQNKCHFIPVVDRPLRPEDRQ